MDFEDSPFNVADTVLFTASPTNSYTVLAILANIGQDALGHTKNNGFSYTLRNRSNGDVCKGHQFSLGLDTRVNCAGGYGRVVQNPTLSQLRSTSWIQYSPEVTVVPSPPVEPDWMEDMDSDEESDIFKISSQLPGGAAGAGPVDSPSGVSCPSHESEDTTVSTSTQKLLQQLLLTPSTPSKGSPNPRLAQKFQSYEDLMAEADSMLDEEVEDKGVEQTSPTESDTKDESMCGGSVPSTKLQISQGTESSDGQVPCKEVLDQAIMINSPRESVKVQSMCAASDLTENKENQPPGSAHESLEEVFRKIGTRDRTHVGLRQLHHYILNVPNVDLEPFLVKYSLNFRAYVDRGLKKIDEKVKGGSDTAGVKPARDRSPVAQVHETQPEGSTMAASQGKVVTKDTDVEVLDVRTEIENDGESQAPDDDLGDVEEQAPVTSMDPNHDLLVFNNTSVAPAKRKSVTPRRTSKRNRVVPVTTDMPCMTDGEDSEDNEEENEEENEEPSVGKPLKKNQSFLQAQTISVEERLSKALNDGMETVVKKKMVKKKTKRAGNKSKKKVAAKPPLYLDDDIPYNPHNLEFEDDEGKILTPGSSAFLSQFSKAAKLTKHTQRRYTAEHNRFERFITKTAGAKVLTDYLCSALPPPQVAELVSDFLLNRINMRLWRTTGEKKYLDTTSARLVWSKISRVMRQKTNYNMTSMPAFQASKDSLSTYLDQAKEVPGLGENAGQAEGLSRVQLSFLLHHDFLSQHTPVGLISLFYISFVVTFLPRVREEAMRVTRGDFKRVMNPDGTVRCVVYCPRGKCKRDRGQRAGDKGAAVFKRPIALPSKEPKISFPVILDTMEAHLDLLPWDGDRADQPMFMAYHKEVPKPGNSFFLENRLGINSFDNILRKVIWSTGLKTTPRQQCNQALRPTAFGIHKLLGLDTSYFMSMAGHVSARTHTIYVRNQVELLEGVTGNFLEATTGVEAVRPSNDTVEIFDHVTHRTEVRRVKDFLPLVTDNGQQTGIYPLSGIDYEELFTLLPEVRDETDQPNPVNLPTSSVPLSTTPANPTITFKRPSDRDLKSTSPSNCSRQPITSTMLDSPMDLSPSTLLDMSPARNSHTTAVDLSCSGPLNLVTPTSRSSKTVPKQSTSDPGPSNKASTRTDFSFKKPRVQLTNRLPLSSAHNVVPMAMMDLSPSKLLGLNLTSSSSHQHLN